MTWVSPADISMLEGFRIFVDNRMEAEIPGADATLGRVATSLRPGQVYRIAVASYSPSAQSALSEPIMFEFKSKNAPAPALLAAPAPAAASAAAAPAVAATATPARPTVTIPGPPATAPPPASVPPAVPASTSTVAPPAVVSHEMNGASPQDEDFVSDDSQTDHNAVNNDDAWSQPRRLFIALCDYNPELDSPNDDFSEELPLSDGQVRPRSKRTCVVCLSV